MAKTCVKCNNPLPDSAQFCERCGTRQPIGPAASRRVKKSSAGTVMIIALLAVIAVAAIVIAVMLWVGNGERKDPVAPPAVTQQETTPEEILPEEEPEDTQADETAPPADEAQTEDSAGEDAMLAQPTPQTEPTEESVAAMSVAQFNEMVEGVWVDYDSLCYDGGQGVFRFCQFRDGQFCYAAYPGGISRTGTVVELMHDTNGGYIVTLLYPEEEYLGDYYQEEYIKMVVTLNGTDLTLNSDPGIVWTWTGADLQQAKEALGIES